MVHFLPGQPDVADFVFIQMFQFNEFQVGAKGIEGHGEVLELLLPFQPPTQALMSPADGELVAGHVHGAEEGNAHDVVPVGVAEKQMGLALALAELGLEQVLPQDTDAGTAVEDEVVFAGPNVDTG